VNEGIIVKYCDIVLYVLLREDPVLELLALSCVDPHSEEMTGCY